MNNNDLLSRLTALDAAPRTEPTADEIDREETLLRTILGDTGRPARSVGAVFRRPLVRRVTFTLASACAAGAAFTFVTGGLPDQGDNGPVSSAELVSWTGTPKALDTAEGKGSAAADQCLDLTAGQGTGTARISNADIRGDVASMVVTRSGDASYCLAGSDGTGFAMAISPVVKLPADGLDLDTYGARGSGDSEFNYVVGAVGADVQEVVVRDYGKTVRATVEDGRMTAWWPGGKPDGLLTGTFTITLKDGTSRTVPANSLMAH